MRRRILWAVAILAMCFSMLSTMPAITTAVSIPQLPVKFTGRLVDGSLTVECYANETGTDGSIEICLFEKGQKDAVHNAVLTENIEVVELTGLAVGKSYGVFMRYTDGGKVKSVSGQLYARLVAGRDEKPTVELHTSLQDASQVSSEYSIMGTIYESEPNGTSSSADIVNYGDTIYGAINPSGDRDWFKVVFPVSGVARLHLSQIPLGCDYDMYLYNASGNPLVGSLNAGSVDETISYKITANTTYYVQVYAYQGYSSSNYSLNVGLNAWYSQRSSEGGAYNWNRSSLSSLYLPNMESCSYCAGVLKCRNTPLWTSSTFVPASNQLDAGHINTWGCVVTSHAMVLRNLAARTTTLRTDFRTGASGYLDADPFTVTMTNIGWPAVASQNGRYEIVSYTSPTTPVYVNSHSALVSAFGKYLYTDTNFINYTDEEKANKLVQYIRDNPSGVMVRLEKTLSDGSKARHTVVFTELTSNASTTSLSASFLSGGESGVVRVTPENEEMLLGDLWTDAAELREDLDVGSAELSIASSTPTIYDDWFIAFDPASATASQSYAVPFNQTWAYANSYGGIGKIISVMWIRHN